MSCVVELSRSRFWPRAAALALMSIGVAACSGESSRLSDSPFGSRSNPEATGSIPQSQAAPAGRVDSRPLPPQTAQAQPGYQPASAAPPPAGAGTAGGGRGLASYTPSPSRPGAPANPEVTGSVAAAPKPAPTGHWTWDGGTPVTVAQGDTVDSIARRYGVPASAIIQSNNMTQPATVHPGQQLVIPRYSAAPGATAAPATRPAPAPSAHRPASAPAMSQAGHPGVHVVTAGETLSKVSRLYGKPVAEVAKANNLPVTAKINVGDRLVIPGVRSSAAKPAASVKAPTVAQAKAPSTLLAPKETDTAPSASVFTPVAEPQQAKDAVKSAEGTGSLPKFRWPANGRVIAGHGPTPNGQQNDGINIALPENTSVKAAEDGVVAYAGNELKGYGNLILVRHPNGYVTAYAHLKELSVKRGDQVKRGQVIARSGQTGNVNTPQLHFEIRKGATPLDPMKFLNGA
jgi:murein DD-endopeptidase MepM/ murein hydrolase activator NlpD